MTLVHLPNLRLWVGSTEVTQSEWKSLVGSNPSFAQGDQKPVENVSLADAQKFCVLLSAKEGGRYRLPKESEWKSICSTAKYASPKIESHAWLLLSSQGAPQSVGTKAPDDRGLFDLQGNVYEWCFRDIKIGNPSKSDYRAPGTNADMTQPVAYGGSYIDGPANCGCDTQMTYPIGSAADVHSSLIGFRVVRDE